METHEADAFGLQPDPVTSNAELSSIPVFWKGTFGVEDPVNAPSTQFVSERNVLRGWR